MKKLVHKLMILTFSSLMFNLFGCTNFELNEVDTRISQSLSGELSSQQDIDPDGTNDFKFSLYGDTHIGSRFGKVLDDAIDRSIALGHAFAIVAGDCTDTGKGGEFTQLIDKFTTKNFLARYAIGNHDVFFGGWKKFRDALGASVYTFNADHVGFFVVDSANGTLGLKQIDWLESQLASSTQPVKIVVSHFSPTVGQATSPWRMSSDEETAIVKDLAHRYNVQLFLAGHWHGYQDIKLGNTRYITSGGVNTVNEPGHIKHMVEIHVSGNQITYSKIDL